VAELGGIRDDNRVSKRPLGQRGYPSGGSVPSGPGGGARGPSGVPNFTTSQAGRGWRQEGQLSLATNVRPGSITSFRAQASTSALPRRLDLLDTDRLFGTTQDHGSSPLADDHDVVLHRFSFHALPSPASPGSPAQHTVARGRSLWGRIAVGHPPCDKSPMAALGQSRCFERALTTSELPRRPDSATQTGSSDEWSRMKIATGRYL
jgi:hypothetical protein